MLEIGLYVEMRTKRPVDNGVPSRSCKYYTIPNYLDLACLLVRAKNGKTEKSYQAAKF